MSIFLTKQVQFATKVEAFEIRGLSGQVSTKAVESGVIPLSIAPPEARIRYEFLQDELVARIRGTPMLYRSPPVLVSALHKFDRIMFEVPTLLVEMKTGGEVLNAHGLYETGTSKMGLYAGKPTTAAMRDIMTLGLDLYSTVPAGNVNLAGYIAFINAWRGITAFFMMGAGNHDNDPAMQIMGAETHKRLEEFTTAEDGTEIVNRGGTFQTRETSFQTGSGFACKLDGVPVATPNTKGFPGMIFPFFKEMLDADPETPFHIFFRLFRFTLVDSVEALAEHAVVLRRGFRYLASTTAGKIVQHIYFGIDLALQTGGTLALIRNGGQYAGFAIKGQHLSVLVKNRIKSALTADEMEYELSQLNTHSKAVKVIFEALLAVGRADGEMESLTDKDLMTNPRMIRKMIMDRRALDIEPLRETLNDQLSELKYDQTYWEINPQNLLNFLMAMSQKRDMTDEPMYIHIDVLMNRSSPALQYLAVFGGQAPSIFHGNTTRRVVNISQEDPNLVKVNNKRVVPHIPYYKKGIIAAAVDWASAKKAKSFKFVGSKGAGPGAGFSSGKERSGVIADPVFDAFYTALRVWIFTEADATVNPGREKRKPADSGDDEDMEEAQPVKKKSNFSFM